MDRRLVAGLYVSIYTVTVTLVTLDVQVISKENVPMTRVPQGTTQASKHDCTITYECHGRAIKTMEYVHMHVNTIIRQSD